MGFCSIGKLAAVPLLAFACFSAGVTVADATPMLPETDIVIDVGHGGVDPGTSFGTLLEKDINLAVAKKLYLELDKRGYHTVLNRIGDYALSEENRWLKHPSRHLKDLRQRNELSKALQPRATVSLHVNSSKSAAKSGPIVIHQNNDASKRLAQSMQHELNALYARRHATIRGKTYFLLNRGPEPSVIVEMGFITNAMDRERLTDTRKQQEVAKAMADGIGKFLGEAPTRYRPLGFQGHQKVIP